MPRKVDDYTHYTLNSQSLRLAEHETAFSFTNDVGCYAFNEWWGLYGESAYRAWVEASLDALNEIHG